MVGGPGDEVVRQVRPNPTSLHDVVDSEVKFLEGEAADLADHRPDQLIRGLGQRVPLRPGRGVTGASLYPEEAVRVQPQPTRAQIQQGMQPITHHQPHPGKGRVQPVDRRLPVLEIVQIHPAALGTGDVVHHPGRRPVGLLDARLVEDHPLQGADDVAVVGQRLFLLGGQIDRVDPLGNLRQQIPGLPRNAHHVVDPGEVLVIHLSQPEISPLAGVTRHDVIDHGTAVLAGDDTQLAELVLGAKERVDRHRDPIEMPVDAGGQVPPGDPPSQLQRAGVHPVDPDLFEGLPQRRRPKRRDE